MGKLDGKVALITGGTTGIGAATARLFRQEGATVIATGSSAKSVDAARGELEGVQLVVSDQADPQAAAALTAQVKAEHGAIDILFVNAGVAHFAPLDQVDEAFFDTQFSINVRGAYFTVKHAAPVMNDGGAVILTASTAAHGGMAGASVYSATKAAVRSFGRTLGAELAPRGIRVNVISPGPVETPIFGKSGMSPQEVQGFKDGVKSRVPMGRIGHADEIAAAVLFLAADASFTTGGEVIAGGGLVDI